MNRTGDSRSTSRRAWNAALTAVFIVLATIDCVDRSSPRHDEPGRIHAEDHGFSVVVPDDWETVTDVEVPGLLLNFKEPARGAFAANFNVRTSAYDGRPPLDELPAELQRSFPGELEVVEDGFTEIDGKRTYFVRVVAPLEGQFVTNTQYFIPREETMYSISFMADADSHQRHEPTFNAILDSVRVD